MAEYHSLITILAPGIIPLASIVLEKEKEKIKHQLGVTGPPSKCTVNTAVAFSSPWISKEVIKNLTMITFTINSSEINSLRKQMPVIENVNLNSNISVRDKILVATFFTKYKISEKNSLGLYHIRNTQNVNEFSITNYEAALKNISKEAATRFKNPVFLGKLSKYQSIKNFLLINLNSIPEHIEITKFKNFKGRNTLEYQKTISMLFESVKEGGNKILKDVFELNSSIYQTKLIDHNNVTERRERRENSTGAVKITTCYGSYLIGNEMIQNSNYEKEFNRKHETVKKQSTTAKRKISIIEDLELSDDEAKTSSNTSDDNDEYSDNNKVTYNNKTEETSSSNDEM